ncbi:MAG TPA: TMEM14 family protein [Chlamydiales bacterium]|jgi:uncharacterized membrane protein (UPF0136 family)
MINPSIRWTILFYGALLVALGIVGYQASHSKVSLIMGASFGLLMMGSSALLFYNKRFGLYSALCLTVLLTGTFFYRYVATHGTLPAFMAVLSGAMLFYLLSQSVKYKK